MAQASLKWLKILCPYLAAIMTLGACASTVPITSLDLETAIQDAEKKGRLVSQFQADFVKTRRLWCFNQELTVEGRLIFQKPRRFWMTLTGDLRVEILSDGEYVKVIHDGNHEEIYPIRGDRDLVQVSDPLMLLIDNIARGRLRNSSVVRTEKHSDMLSVEIHPENEHGFEKTDRVLLSFSQLGDIRKVTVEYKDGNVDRTIFKSWAILDSQGPEIDIFNRKLQTVSQQCLGRQTSFTETCKSLDYIF